jgi:hypothetical protein
MGLLQSQRQGPRVSRNDNQMYIVGHEAVAEQQQRMKSQGLPQEIEINQALGIGSEKELPSIAALRHVVRNIYDYGTGKTSHSHQIIRNVPSVPGSHPRFPMGQPERNWQGFTRQSDRALLVRLRAHDNRHR